MSERDFVYFLQGFIELNGGVPTEIQWQQIKDHLALVFNKVTPTYSPQTYCVGSLPDKSPEFIIGTYNNKKLCSLDILDTPCNNPNSEYPTSC